MFDKETKFITDFIFNKMKHTASGISFEELLHSDIHPAILKYISSEIDYFIYQDRKKLLDSSIFDYSGPEITRYFNLIGEEIKKSKKISLEDLKKLITQAVSFNLNFVSRPRWTLIKLVYNESAEKRMDEIQFQLNHIYFYDYMRNIIISYASKRRLAALSRIEFELIINKIDKELFTSQSPRLIANALNSMNEIINYGGSLSTKIPVQPLETFLKEKNLLDYLFRLRRAVPVDTNKRYDVEDLKNLLFSFAPVEQQIYGYDVPEELKEIEAQQEPTQQPIPPQEVPPEEPIPEILPPEPHPEPEREEPEKPWEPDTDTTKFFIPGTEGIPRRKGDDDEFSEEGEMTPEEEEIFLDESPSPDEEKLPDLPASDEEEYIINLPEEDDILKIYDEELKSLEELERQLSLSDEEAVNKDFEFEEESEEEEEKQIHDELLGSNEFLVTGEDADIPVNSKERLEHISDAEKEIQSPKEKNRFSFFRKKEKESEQPEGQTGKDIFSVFSNREMDRIVSSIFNEDREDFVTTLEKIAECSNYEDATEIIKSVFLTYRINPYSRDAVALTNGVANYFNQA